MDQLMAISIVGIVTWGIYRLFELFARRKERLTLIEKLGSDLNFDVLKKELYLPVFKAKTPDVASWALRISLLMMGIGFGLIIAFFIQAGLFGRFFEESVQNGQFHRIISNTMEVVYFACVAIFGGLGLLIAFFIEQKKNKEKN